MLKVIKEEYNQTNPRVFFRDIIDSYGQMFDLDIESYYKKIQNMDWNPEVTKNANYIYRDYYLNQQENPDYEEYTIKVIVPAVRRLINNNSKEDNRLYNSPLGMGRTSYDKSYKGYTPI